MGKIRPMVHKAAKNKEKEEVRADTTENMKPGVKHPSLTVANNINLTEPEKEILRWHQRLGHISVRKVQWMMRAGILGRTEADRRLHATAAKLNQGEPM